MARTICLVMGIVFLIVGVWGWINGERVLIFHVNPLHNAVHLASGVTALIFAFGKERAARSFCYVFGVVYGLVAILGFLNVQPVVDLLHLNNPDDWLHIVISAAFILAALISRATEKQSHNLQPPRDAAMPPVSEPRPAP